MGKLLIKNNNYIRKYIKTHSKKNYNVKTFL